LQGPERVKNNRRPLFHRGKVTPLIYDLIYDALLLSAG
jgi:hypothetical protein